MRIKSLILAALCMATVGVYAQSNYPFNGLDMNMGNFVKTVRCEDTFHQP